ncbi:MAG: SMI1/KNR4 family protein [Janthinobacterium lividum]
MRNLAEISLKYYPADAASPAHEEPPSAAVIEEFEKHFQVKLPTDYVSFLQTTNGGNPTIDTFDYITSVGEFVHDADQVGEFFSLTMERKSQYEEGVWEYTEWLQEVFIENGWPSSIVCIGRNGADNMIYLDTTKPTPPVHILYRECENATPQIALSFGEFIDNLHSGEQNETDILNEH